MSAPPLLTVILVKFIQKRKNEYNVKIFSLSNILVIEQQDRLEL